MQSSPVGTTAWKTNEKVRLLARNILKWNVGAELNVSAMHRFQKLNNSTLKSTFKYQVHEQYEVAC